jgi:uncharacterized protein (DUF488 family)
MNTIYTIGHSSHDIDYFLELLKMHNINTVVDARSVPFSKYVPHFNKDDIKRTLFNNKITFIYMGTELGIRQKDKNLFSETGLLDYDKVKSSQNFLTGIERLKNGIFMGYKIAVMCSEKDPVDCHRSILIGEELFKQTYNVLHILPDGSIQTHSDFLERLTDMYFSDRTQTNIFQILSSDSYNMDTSELACSRRYKELVKDLDQV